jgi:sRNA-binding regulator protein Hfq
MKKYPSKTVIKEIASYFDQELQITLPLSVMPDGSLVYKDFLVKQLDNLNWGMYNLTTKDLINEYYLKSSALIASKAYNHRHYAKYYEINELDRKYAVLSNDNLIFKHNLDTVTDLSNHDVLLTKFEENSLQYKHYKKLILLLFRQTFI